MKGRRTKPVRARAGVLVQPVESGEEVLPHCVRERVAVIQRPLSLCFPALLTVVQVPSQQAIFQDVCC